MRADRAAARAGGRAIGSGAYGASARGGSDVPRGRDLPRGRSGVSINAGGGLGGGFGGGVIHSNLTSADNPLASMASHTYRARGPALVQPEWRGPLDD